MTLPATAIFICMLLNLRKSAQLSPGAWDWNAVKAHMLNFGHDERVSRCSEKPL
jgi:hypothetical protein